MVVHHAACLHEGIANGGADEFKAVGQQHFAHRVRFCSFCGYLGDHFPCVHDGLATYDLPQKGIETAVLFLRGQTGFGIANGAEYF